MPGNVDAVLFITGFLVGGACVGTLGFSLVDDYPRRYVVSLTVVAIVVCGTILGWSLNYFMHWAHPSS
jgi:hypothetical protein